MFRKLLIIALMLSTVPLMAQQRVVAVSGSTTAVTGNVTVVGTAADGAAVSGNPVRIAGKDGSANTQDILVNTAGNVTIAYGDGTAMLPTDVVHVIADSGTITTVGTVTTVSTVTAVTNVATIGTSVTPGTAAANLGKAEDAVAASGDTGVSILAVAQATPTATAADGDYIAVKTNANGVIWSQPISVGATGAAVPANAEYGGAQDASGNLIGDINCTASKVYDTNSNGNVELVALSGSKHVYVCGYEMAAGGTVNLQLVAGTGTACASAASGATSTGTSGASAALTPAWQFTAQTGIVSQYPTHGYLIDAGSANALCLKTSAGVSAQVQVFYSQR